MPTSWTRTHRLRTEPLTWMGIRLTDWSMHRADRRPGRRTLLLKGLEAVGMGFDS